MRTTPLKTTPSLLRISALAAALALANPAFAQQNQQTGQQERQDRQTQQTQQGQQGQQNTQQQQRVTKEQVQGQGTPIHLSPSAVRKVQEALNDAGFDAGPANGEWTDRTRRAARAYQKSKNIEPTGNPTMSLINCVGGDNEGQSLLRGEYRQRDQGAQGNQTQQQQTQQQNDQQGNTQAQGQGTPIYASPAQVRLVQQELNKADRSSGPVDGIWGEKTRSAAMAFQQENDLAQNGQLTISLINQLGINETFFSTNCAGDERDTVPGVPWVQDEDVLGGTPIFADPVQVGRIQNKLKENYDVGPVDGLWGESTRQAVMAYQRENNLQPTGTLTTSLLAGLGMRDWHSEEHDGRTGDRRETNRNGNRTGTQQNRDGENRTGTEQNRGTGTMTEDMPTVRSGAATGAQLNEDRGANPPVESQNDREGVRNLRDERENDRRMDNRLDDGRGVGFDDQERNNQNREATGTDY